MRRFLPDQFTLILIAAVVFASFFPAEGKGASFMMVASNVAISLLFFLHGARLSTDAIVAGVKVKADPDFRLVATMNDDASTFELPEYTHSRLQPQITIDFPERDEERRILEENLPFAEGRILDYVTDFLQKAHESEERYTVRDGINVARFALKLADGAGRKQDLTAALRSSVLQTLGEEAVRYLPRG